jgi:hypothetical protein
LNAQTGVFDITTWVKDLIARMDGLSNNAKGTYLQKQGISPVGDHKTLNDRFKQSQKASKLTAPKPKSAKTALLAAWNKTERTSKFKCIEDIPYPSQKIADNPSARLRGEQERLLTNLYHNHVNRMRKKASTAKNPKDGREDEGGDESEGKESERNE